MLSKKNIVLGITGGIAAFKAAELASKLTKEGAKVRVVMTDAAVKFITPLTLSSLTHEPVVTDIFQSRNDHGITHINIAGSADVVVIAPATANTIAKLAAGISDNLLTCTVLATKAPVVLAPAMNDNMFENPVTQDNLAQLKARGFTIVGPDYGRLASGKMGQGRLVDTGDIVTTVRQVLARSGDLAGRYFVVTAGGTEEPIDPVRYLGNRSSGKMGFAVAEAARDRGADVSLVRAQVSLTDPPGMEIISARTAFEMKEAVIKAVGQADVLVMVAAVADYQPKNIAKNKIKKTADNLMLELVRTPDILNEVKGKFIKVGFAAESEDIIENARKKLKEKQLDIIIANDITSDDSGFGTDTNKVVMIDSGGKTEDLPLLTKREVADRILDKVAGLLNNNPINDIEGEAN
ncbi:bifunctional phosphopantothenoylcysteine decarboxylase/phosphopantothenate--cysteine ligase CoaBC [Chloroflexota bacterium]